jgi:hypothetical protein
MQSLETIAQVFICQTFIVDNERRIVCLYSYENGNLVQQYDLRGCAKHRENWQRFLQNTQSNAVFSVPDVSIDAIEAGYKTGSNQAETITLNLAS